MKTTARSLVKRSLAALIVGGGVIVAGSAGAMVSLTLPEAWYFDPDGDGGAVLVEKLGLTGWSHIDNTFGPNTFIEQGILQVDTYIDPTTGTSKPISNLTSSDIYVSWTNVTGTFTLTGTDADIDFDTTNVGNLNLFVDATPTGTLKINDGGLANDANSFLNLANGLTKIASFAIINGALNTDTNLFEFSGGSFDINLTPGGTSDGQFVIWGATDVLDNRFFYMDATTFLPGDDLDTVDDDSVDSLGNPNPGAPITFLQSRLSVDAQQSPFTFKDGTSTAPPGLVDDADASQEDNFEAAIAAIHGVAASDLMQTQIDLTGDGRPDGYQDFFAFHRGDYDKQVNVVPEPGTMLLLGTGLLGLARVGSRRRSS